FSSRRRHTRSKRDWSSDVCSSDLSSTAAQQHSIRPNTPDFKRKRTDIRKSQRSFRFRLRRAAKSASRPRVVPFPRLGVSGLASALARHDLRRPAGGRAGGNSTALLLPFVGKLVIKLRVEFLGAIRTDSMGKVGV